MGVIRKDYLLDKYVYYAVKRGDRPKEFKKTAMEVRSPTDFFAAGNEHLTPPEKGRVRGPKGWLIRWFDNKFGALELQGNSAFTSNPKQSSNYGVHEVIAETPGQEALAELSIEHITSLLHVYAHRIKELSKVRGIAYALVFKNHGSEAGTSLLHEHSQVMAIPHVPPAVMEEVRASKKSKISPYLAIAKKEIKTKRGIAQNKSFIAFCPFASTFNYEAWIFPKRDMRTFDDFKQDDFEDLSEMLKKILMRLHTAGASYNFYIHYAPKGSNLPFHIIITPRMATWGGFELGSGCIINSVMPEDAAAFYKETIPQQNP
jgi:UDPglucose--hexose-1-phosphate uridylyltransferase